MRVEGDGERVCRLVLWTVMQSPSGAPRGVVATGGPGLCQENKFPRGRRHRTIWAFRRPTRRRGAGRGGAGQVAASTNYGEEVYVCGSDPALGRWLPAQGVRLSTTREMYPQWIGRVELPTRRGGERVMYKYVIRSLGDRWSWEDRIADRQLAPDGPEVVLNDGRFKQASILLSGANFGCGSSREHAPQAIQKYGFRAVVAENFAEIFFGNCTTLGIPCFTATREDIAKVAAAIEANPAIEVVADVAAQEIRFGSQSIKANVRDSARDALVNGRWDAIGELIDGMGDVKAKAAGLPYLAA